MDQLLKYHQHNQQLKQQGYHNHMMRLSNNHPQNNSFASIVNKDAANETVIKQQQDMERATIQFQQEQQHLQGILNEIIQERENSLTVLALSCGISIQNNVSVLDETLFNAIIATIKGKKLMSSVFTHLSPERRWCILPLLLSKILQTIDTSANNDENCLPGTVAWIVQQERDVELKLLNDFLEVFLCIFLFLYITIDIDYYFYYYYYFCYYSLFNILINSNKIKRCHINKYFSIINKCV